MNKKLISRNLLVLPFDGMNEFGEFVLENGTWGLEIDFSITNEVLLDKLEMVYLCV